MKALRNWVADDGRLMTKGTERIILAMADVMETSKRVRKARKAMVDNACPECLGECFCGDPICDEYDAALTAAQSVIKEVTG